MNFESFLALRYIKPRGENRFISFSSLMSILGIIIGVAALIIVMGVMSGFDQELQSKIVGATPNVIIRSFSGTFRMDNKLMKTISGMKGVSSVYPVLVTQCIVSANGLSTGAVLNGMEFHRGESLMKYIRGNPGGGGIIMGSQLMKMLGVKVGNKVRVILPFGKTTPFGFAPLSFVARVSGVFNSGMYEYDVSFMYIPLKEMWEKTDMSGLINTIAVNLKDPYKANEFVNNIVMKLPPGFYATSWIEMNSNFFTALKLEKIAMFIVLMLVIIVAAFNIMSSLTMLVMDKMRDIAILVSFGATSRNIRNIFLKQSLIIGFVGVMFGDVLGIVLSLLLKRYHFIKLPSDVYYITTIPVSLSPEYILAVSVGVLVLVSLSSVYPAYKATRINIVEVLRQ